MQAIPKSRPRRRKSKKGLKLELRNSLVGYSFILPNFIGFGVFVLVPIVFSMVLSFMHWDGFTPMRFAGLANFTKIFADQYFLQALGRTLGFTVFCVLTTTAAALGLAVLLNKKIFGRSVFRGSIFFPYVASIVAVGVVWNMMFQRDFGPINEFLRWLGVQNPPGWTASTDWALPAVAIVNVWKGMGYYMIVYLAALQDVPVDLREASMIDGAGGFKHFWRVVWPCLMPSTFFVVLMTTINSFKCFDLILVMTEGGPGQATTLIVNYIYKQGFVSENYGVASAAAMVLFLIVGVITVIQFRAEKKWNDSNG